MDIAHILKCNWIRIINFHFYKSANNINKEFVFFWGIVCWGLQFYNLQPTSHQEANAQICSRARTPHMLPKTLQTEYPRHILNWNRSLKYNHFCCVLRKFRTRRQQHFTCVYFVPFIQKLRHSLCVRSVRGQVLAQRIVYIVAAMRPKGRY